MGREPTKTGGDRAATVSSAASAAGVAWSLFWLFESFGELPSVWELIVPAVTIAGGAVAAVSAVVALRRRTSQRTTAIVGLFLGGALIAWGIALVPLSVERVSPPASRSQLGQILLMADRVPSAEEGVRVAEVAVPGPPRANLPTAGQGRPATSAEISSARR